MPPVFGFLVHKTVGSYSESLVLKIGLRSLLIAIELDLTGCRICRFLGGNFENLLAFDLR